MNDGYAIVRDVFSQAEMAELWRKLELLPLLRSRAGARHLLKHAEIAALADDPRMIRLASDILGEAAQPFGATLFDKSPQANWLVSWHQDTALPRRQRVEQPGWGPWSEKDGVLYAHAPAAALEQVCALRVHLDDSTVDNGPLRLIPGSHGCGVLTDAEVHAMMSAREQITCLVNRGGVIAMRPLPIHASSKVATDAPRRVIHIEYATPALAGVLANSDAHL
jgi:ectoine hydroxylase-related dioxygenase (phytanoyl-CoA dioxygenase family)